jgi:hypothetical protein
MSETSVPQARAIVRGAAHGAWMVVLLASILVGVAWILIVLVKAFAPGVLTGMTGVDLPAMWSLALYYVTGMKLLIWGWLMGSIFLSYWWRALPA